MAQGNNSIELSARIKDWIAQSQRYHVPVLSCFLTEEEQALLKNMCRNGLVQLYGGCDAAIRQRAASCVSGLKNLEGFSSFLGILYISSVNNHESTVKHSFNHTTVL